MHHQLSLPADNIPVHEYFKVCIITDCMEIVQNITRAVRRHKCSLVHHRIGLILSESVGHVSRPNQSLSCA